MSRNWRGEWVTSFDLYDARRSSDVASIRLTSVSLLICVSCSLLLVDRP
jgi:hypothetical protein